MPATPVPSTSALTARDRLLAELGEALEALSAAGLGRRLPRIEAVDGAVLLVEGRRLIGWCANDYLGLAGHPALAAAVADAAAEFGVGSRASRLLCGTTRWHAALEAALAAWFAAEAALVFPTGYHANLGALGALLGPGDAVAVDRLAHASLVDAARATQARLRIFRHNDPGHAADVLARLPGRRRAIVTEGLFSMEGDRAPLAALLDAAERTDALVYVDDAHGAFVLGATGRGAPEAAGVPMDRLIYMATLGKALGGQGGFVAGPRVLIEYLVNRARPFLYTTGLATPLAAAASAALHVAQDEPWRRQRLWALAGRLHARLAARGWGGGEPSPILPIVLGEPDAARAASELLARLGHFVPPIRPPTVPRGTSRLRISLSAAHTEAQADALADALAAVLPATPAAHPRRAAGPYAL